MSLEILLDNRDGNVLEMPVSSVNFKTSRIAKASVLEAVFIIEEPLKYPIKKGAVIRVKHGSTGIFYGYVFESVINESSELKVKAYDQLRYLMYKDTFVLKAMTATAAIKHIAGLAGAKIGAFEDTGYIVPAKVEDDKNAFDVVCQYLDATLIAKNRLFVLRDEFGSLILKRIDQLLIDPSAWYLGEESLMYGFEFTESIDKDTYNRIKLVKDDEETSKRKVYIAQDSSNIAKWGQLQYFKKVDENMTDAQIKASLEALLAVKNQATKDLSIKCLGHWGVKAGNMIYVVIEKIGVREAFLVEECTHDWNGGVHTMDLKLKVVN